MTSRTSLTALVEAMLVSREYNDVTGTVTVNVTDALMAIAHAINRLAVVQEKSVERQTNAADQMLAMLMSHDTNGVGHG
jgi:hypothetical protein